MKLRHLTKLSTRMFKARPSRTLLTILGMGIGFAAILFLVSLGFGLQKAILETITTSDALSSLDVLGNAEQKITLTPERVRSLEQIDGVEKISLAYQTEAEVKFQDRVTESEATLVDSSFLSLDGKKIAGGTMWNENEKGVIISGALVKSFSKEPNEMLGQDIQLTFLITDKTRFVQRGQSAKQKVALDKPVKILGYIDSEEPMVYFNQAEVGSLITINEYSRLKVKCQSSSALESVRSQINELGLTVSSVADVVSQAEKIFKVIRIILAFFGVIALVVSAIGMFNTMTVTLLERTEEIGIMKSIGASDGNILTMFIFESTLMGFLGGIFGIIIGWLSSQGVNIIVAMIARRFGGQAVDIFYCPFWFLLLILGLSVIVGFITGVIPAKRASSIDPLEALRYK